MILWAIALSAMAGFLLGLHCRLLLLAVASTGVAIGLPLALRFGDGAPDLDLVATIGLLGLLLVVLQGFFLAGATLRVSGPATRSATVSLASPPASRTSGP